MAVDKGTPLEPYKDELPTEAPPAYTPSDAPGPSSSSSKPASHPPQPSTSRPTHLSSPLPSHHPRRPSTASSLLSALLPSPAAADLRATVRSILSALVREPSADVAPGVEVLKDCAAACRARGVDFAALCQEKSVEWREPLYWCLLKQEPGKEDEDNPLLHFLLSQPLQPSTISSARLAILSTSSDPSLQLLLRALPTSSPLLATLSHPTTRVLTPPPASSLLADDPTAFRILLHLPSFHARLRASKAGTVSHEFAARNRIWRLEVRLPTPSAAPTHPPHRNTRHGHRAAALYVYGFGLRVVEGAATHVQGSGRILAGREGRDDAQFRLPSAYLDPVQHVLPSFVRLEQVRDARSLEFHDSPLLDEDGALRIMADVSLTRDEATGCTIS